MLKKAIKVLSLCLLVAFMTSCQTKEEKVINRMNALAERIENQTESFTDEEWDVINSDFEMLKAQAEECNFTSEQRTAYAKAEAEVTAAILKQRAKEVGNGIREAFDQGKDMFNGIIDGIKEGLGGGEEATNE